MPRMYGRISCDSHAQPDRDAFTSRMSMRKWGDAIPHVESTSDKAHMSVPFDHPVDRWVVNGQVVGTRGVVNCPTVMDDPMRKTFPQHWDEVPPIVYEPIQRLTALDKDGVDAEVLFPNDPVQSGHFFQGDAAFELDCVRAYNDWLAGWKALSPRYAPLALIPYMSDVAKAIAEVERAAKLGHRGITMLAEPSQNLAGLKHFNDPYWYPLWDACQQLEMPVHWHGNAGLGSGYRLWRGYSVNWFQAIFPVISFSITNQFIVNLIFSGLLDKFPRLKWVSAETGIGWMNYVIEGADYEWERRHLWTEGIVTRPSDAFRRQMYVDFWYEKIGIRLRNSIGIDNIMWESDYPHSTSTYPESRTFTERTLEGIPDDEKEKLLYQNAAGLYFL